MKPAEYNNNAEALAALRTEWDRLQVMKCWREDDVHEWSQVAYDARKWGFKAHVGNVFAMCVEKGS